MVPFCYFLVSLFLLSWSTVVGGDSNRYGLGRVTRVLTPLVSPPLPLIYTMVVLRRVNVSD